MKGTSRLTRPRSAYALREFVRGIFPSSKKSALSPDVHSRALSHDEPHSDVWACTRLLLYSKTYCATREMPAPVSSSRLQIGILLFCCVSRARPATPHPLFKPQQSPILKPCSFRRFGMRKVMSRAVKRDIATTLNHSM